MTLAIHLENGSTIDIDIVPVFALKPEQLKSCYPRVWSNIGTEHNGPHWLQTHARHFQAAVRIALQEEFFVVPKPSPAGIEREWRLDFHNAEKKIIDNKGVAKPVIKILKLFRSNNAPLKSLSR